MSTRRILLFFVIFAFFASFLTHRVYAGCCLDLGSYYCNSYATKDDCGGNYDNDNDCSEIADCTLGCCCNVDSKQPLIGENAQTYLGVCKYYNTSGNLAFYAHKQDCSTFCSSIGSGTTPTSSSTSSTGSSGGGGSSSFISLEEFLIRVVCGEPSVIVEWKLQTLGGGGGPTPSPEVQVTGNVVGTPSTANEISMVNIYYCKYNPDLGACISKLQTKGMEASGGDITEGAITFNNLDWYTYYKFYVNVTFDDGSYKAFTDQAKIAYTGNESCSEKDCNVEFCDTEKNKKAKCVIETDGNIIKGNIYKLLEESCSTGSGEGGSSGGNSCEDRTGPLGLFGSAEECESDGKCFFDIDSTGAFNCYNCSYIKHCYDYKSQYACQTDACGVGDCEWHSFFSGSGINLGVCVDANPFQCVLCNSLYSNNRVGEKLENKSANLFLFYDCFGRSACFWSCMFSS